MERVALRESAWAIFAKACPLVLSSHIQSLVYILALAVVSTASHLQAVGFALIASVQLLFATALTGLQPLFIRQAAGVDSADARSDLIRSFLRIGWPIGACAALLFAAAALALLGLGGESRERLAWFLLIIAPQPVLTAWNTVASAALIHQKATGLIFRRALAVETARAAALLATLAWIDPSGALAAVGVISTAAVALTAALNLSSLVSRGVLLPPARSADRAPGAQVARRALLNSSDGLFAVGGVACVTAISLAASPSIGAITAMAYSILRLSVFPSRLIGIMGGVLLSEAIKAQDGSRARAGMCQ
jgi:hypothetical protein